MFDFFVKIWGATLAGVIFFTPINIDFANNNLFIKTRLENPVTEDINKLIDQGFVFKVDYYCSIIINDRKVHKTNIIRSIGKDNYYTSDFSNIEIRLESVDLEDGDDIILFIKAKIVDDPLFKESTGLDTEILWKNFVPREKRYYTYIDKKFVESPQ